MNISVTMVKYLVSPLFHHREASPQLYGVPRSYQEKSPVPFVQLTPANYPEKYNSAEKIFEQFHDLSPNKTTVGTEYGNVIRPDVRECYYLVMSRVEFIQESPRSYSYPHSFSPAKINEYFLRPMIPDRFSMEEISLRTTSDTDHSVRTTSRKNSKGEPREWQLLKYTEGNFFTKHTDGKKSPRHFATALLFPPVSMSPFTGGDLVLYPDGDLNLSSSRLDISKSAPVRIEPSKMTEWTLVVFRVEVPHECTPVTSGSRFVLKTELELPEEKPYFTNTEPTTTLATIRPEDYAPNYEAKIAPLEKKIARYRTKMEMLSKGELTDRVKNIVDNATSGDIIVLETTKTSPEELIGEEAQLWNEVVRQFPYSTLTTIKASSNRGDSADDRACDELSFDEEELRLSGTIVYWKDPSKHVLGKIEETRSEYNDNTYDLYYDLLVTAICVQREKFDPNGEERDEKSENDDDDKEKENNEKENNEE